MKKLFTLLFTLAAFGVSNAQNTTIPKEGVVLTVENTKVVTQKDVPYEFDITMIRSKRARKAKFELPRFFGPKGIDFEVAQSADNSDVYNVTASFKNIEPGKYYYTVTSKSKGMHRAKGFSMSFEISDGVSIASNE